MRNKLYIYLFGALLGVFAIALVVNLVNSLRVPQHQENAVPVLTADMPVDPAPDEYEDAYQTADTQSMPPSGEPDVLCLKCHSCDSPTTEQPCPPKCMRNLQEEQRKAEIAKISHLEDIIVIDQNANIYEPVYFEHKKHAGMAAFGKGCEECHHFSPAGDTPPACVSCHDAKVDTEHIKMPGLKGAYHRQCLKCHSKWGGDDNCQVCHVVKGAKSAKKPGENQLDQLRKEPSEIITFKTGLKHLADVKFNHKAHMTDYNFQCYECHKMSQNCGDCHNSTTLTTAGKTTQPIHTVCASCHGLDSCDRCHPGATTKSFDHSQTGWVLNSYHKQLSCRLCHKEKGHYIKQKTQCNFCHEGWNQDNFNHKKATGYELAGIHATLECKDCHINGNFTNKPSCKACHEDK